MAEISVVKAVDKGLGPEGEEKKARAMREVKAGTWVGWERASAGGRLWVEGVEVRFSVGGTGWGGAVVAMVVMGMSGMGAEEEAARV